MSLFSLCPQLSGRSLASPAQHRGSRLPRHDIYIHVTWQTTTVNLRHDNTTGGKWNRQYSWDSADDSNHINTERGHYFGAEQHWTDQQRTGWWWEACYSASCDSFYKGCCSCCLPPHPHPHLHHLLLILLLLLFLLPLRASHPEGQCTVWKRSECLYAKMFSLSLSYNNKKKNIKNNIELFDDTVLTISEQRC